MVEAIRLAEETGALDDASVLREAASTHQGPAERITERALLLATRIGLVAEWERMGRIAPIVLIAMVALVVFAGLGLAGSVTGDAGRKINLVVALVSLLGLHAVTLVLWVIGSMLPSASFSWSFGAIGLALCAKVAGGKQGQAALLLRAVTGLLARARLLPWVLGGLSHLVWTLSFLVVVASLVFALAFRNYTLSWETTILEPGFFVRVVEWSSWLPGRLGFPVPSPADVLTPDASAAGQRTLALWLTGCIVAYGLMPRLLLTLVCGAVWWVRKKSLQPELGLAYFRRLAARFDRLAPPRILDADTAPKRKPTAGSTTFQATTDAVLLIGFELADETPWPPLSLSAAGSPASDPLPDDARPPADHPPEALRIDGSGDAVRRLLDRLALLRPSRCVIACQATSSPDRGTERFVREVASLCGECRLVLLDRPEGRIVPTPARWSGWLEQTGLARVLATEGALS
ncbi:conserved membrane hypothetical protein [Burkholderiales bacterium 8X]|nr:conserved membrane hypothetical protein [Burkholderiales bacterium 8X]